MPDVRDVFDVATRRVRPDPGAFERQQRSQQRRAATRKAAVYALVSTIAVAGIVAGVVLSWRSPSRGGLGGDPDGPRLQGSPPTVNRLAGIWLKVEPGSAGPLMVSFPSDGTALFDDWGQLDVDPGVRATYEIDGDRISFTSDRAGAAGCPIGDTWAWRVRIPEEGRLSVVIVESGTGNCAVQVGDEWTFTRVSPASPASLLMAASAPAKGAAPPRFRADLVGIWLQLGSGRLLRISVDGSYARDDRGLLGVDPFEVGTVELGAGGTLTFRSGTRSRGCADARTIWERARLESDVLSAVVTRDPCNNELGERLIWIRVSPG